MKNRTFEGLVYEWSNDIAKENPNSRFNGITLSDIRRLKKLLSYESGFDECIEMCIKIVDNCSINGKLDVKDSANFLKEKIRELNGSHFHGKVTE